MPLRVVPEQLANSALQVGLQADGMSVGYAAAHGRMEAAQVGWVGRSAPALAAKLTEWQATVVRLQIRVTEHGEDLHRSAERYGTTDIESAEQVDNASEAIERLAGQQGL